MYVAHVTHVGHLVTIGLGTVASVLFWLSSDHSITLGTLQQCGTHLDAPTIGALAAGGVAIISAFATAVVTIVNAVKGSGRVVVRATDTVIAPDTVVPPVVKPPVQ